MSNEKRSRSEQSDAPGHDLRSERDQVLQKFTRGARLSEEVVRDYELVEQRLRELEQENAALRAKVETDDAIRELLRKIELLEQEKADLVSRYRTVEALSTKVTERVHEVETEFSNLASLFVASNQIHSSLSPRSVTRRIKEVLAQIVGAERYSMYLINPEGTELVPIASEGVPGANLVPVRLDSNRIGMSFLNGSAFIDEESDPSKGTFDKPAAILPLSVDEQVVGVIVIFSTLSQKEHFETVDFELFRLLGQHAAAALVGASLFASAGRKMPGLEAFLDLSV